MDLLTQSLIILYIIEIEYYTVDFYVMSNKFNHLAEKDIGDQSIRFIIISMRVVCILLDYTLSNWIIKGKNFDSIFFVENRKFLVGSTLIARRIHVIFALLLDDECLTRLIYRGIFIDVFFYIPIKKENLGNVYE